MTHVDNTSERLVTAKEIAELLTVSSKWVYSACRLYGMPHYQVGRYKRFSPTEVLTWLKENDFNTAQPTTNRMEVR